MSLGLFMNEVEKLHKYGWHDLRKNPDDLPENDGWYIVYKELYYGGNYKHYKFVRTCKYNHTTKSFDCGSCLVVKAWRKIEPFEEEE